MPDVYLTAKTLHIIAIISWMAGVLYFYRLFVYHREEGVRSPDNHQLLCRMERNLFKIIAFPAMIFAILTGVILVWINPSYLHQLWFRIKALSALCLIGVTLYGLKICRQFEKKDFSGFTGKQLRILNEVPTLLMFIIVAMVIFRP